MDFITNYLQNEEKKYESQIAERKTEISKIQTHIEKVVFPALKLAREQFDLSEDKSAVLLNKKKDAHLILTQASVTVQFDETSFHAARSDMLQATSDCDAAFQDQKFLRFRIDALTRDLGALESKIESLRPSPNPFTPILEALNTSEALRQEVQRASEVIEALLKYPGASDIIPHFQTSDNTHSDLELFKLDILFGGSDTNAAFSASFRPLYHVEHRSSNYGYEGTSFHLTPVLESASSFGDYVDMLKPLGLAARDIHLDTTLVEEEDGYYAKNLFLPNPDASDESKAFIRIGTSSLTYDFGGNMSPDQKPSLELSFSRYPSSY